MGKYEIYTSKFRCPKCGNVRADDRLTKTYSGDSREAIGKALRGDPHDLEVISRECTNCGYAAYQLPLDAEEAGGDG